METGRLFVRYLLGPSRTFPGAGPMGLAAMTEMISPESNFLQGDRR